MKKEKMLDIPKEGFCRAEQFAYVLGISESLLWQWVKDGVLPAPEKMEGARISRWPVNIVRKVIAAQGGYVQQPIHQGNQPTVAS